ncbi:MAG TPA: PQQ-binding-like beta-propeller repeat protein [Acidimicrobiales bacterium]|nr:PQQ-binding-like beta-propeller repeat protein [Acidimicrobiales bacterium]
MVGVRRRARRQRPGRLCRSLGAAVAITAALVSAGCSSAPGAPAASGPSCGHSTGLPSTGVAAVAVDAAGHVCWAVAVPGSPVGLPVAGTPVVAAGLALFSVDDDVVAVDLRSGRRVWTWRSGEVTDGGVTPVVVAASQSVAVVAGSVNGGLLGLRLSDGSVAWTTRSLPFGARPTIGVGGSLLLSGIEGDPVEAVDISSGRVAWTAQPAARPVPHVPAMQDETATPVDVGATVISAELSVSFLGSDARASTTLVATDAATGVRRWALQAPYGTTLSAVGPVVVFSGPVTGASATAVTAVDAATGRQLWTATGPPDAQWAADDGALVSTSSTTVTRLDPATGRPLWQVPGAAGAGGTVLLLGQTVVVDALASGHADVAGYDVSTGARLWERADLAGPVESAGRPADPSLIIAAPVRAAGDGVSALDPRTGATRWSVVVPRAERALGRPAVAGGGIIEVIGPAAQVGDEGH